MLTRPNAKRIAELGESRTCRDCGQGYAWNRRTGRRCKPCNAAHVASLRASRPHREPLPPGPSPLAPLVAVLSRIVVSGGGCWLDPTTNGHGYGIVGEQRLKSHRVVYQALKGGVPDGLVLDHLCRNRACVNPEHLEPVTNRENLLRGEGCTARNARKTHCVNGHELSGDNLHAFVWKGQPTRRCRACDAQRKRVARSARVDKLLSDDEQLRDDLQNARSADEAACIRADLHATQHSLWLAGYSPEAEV